MGHMDDVLMDILESKKRIIIIQEEKQ